MKIHILFFLATAWMLMSLLDPATAQVPPLEPPYALKEVEGVEKVRLLPPGEGNPRNSEGDFVVLADGSVLFLYTHFTGGGGDHDTAFLAARRSLDGGRTWTQQSETVLENESGYNIMSVSLLRLQDGDIGLFYLQKESDRDCRPVMRRSRDEGKTWSEPVMCIQDEPGYYVLNNDRAVQLQSGRIVLPVALHHGPDYEKADWKGRVMCYWSDDGGVSWQRSRSVWSAHDRESGQQHSTQEPGVVELADGKLMMFIRSDAGVQLQSFSEDGGDTWSEPVKSALHSPASPASIKSIPSTGHLLAVWNDHDGLPEALAGRRTPFAVAVSTDQGKTWGRSKILEDDPNGWYCYTAMEFVGDRVLLGHCAGDRRTGGLNLTQITSFPVAWLYAEE